ncbi:MAG: alpha/beta fold hydrolase [Pseudomonadota bacterium]
MSDKRFEGGSHVAIEGDGPPVVLIHGVGLDHTMWDAQVSALAQRYTTIRYDMLGHGSTPRPDKELELADFAEQLERLCDALELDRFALVGLSMGVLVSLKFALSKADRLTALVLMNGVYDRTEEQLAGIRGRIAQAETEGTQALIDAALERWLSETYRQQNPEAVAAIRKRLESNNPADFLAAYKIFAGADPQLTGRLSSVACPTLVTTGELDRGSLPTMSQAMAAAIPNAECVILEGLRHLPTTEGADTVNALLLDFLDRTVPR